MNSAVLTSVLLFFFLLASSSSMLSVWAPPVTSTLGTTGSRSSSSGGGGIIRLRDNDSEGDQQPPSAKDYTDGDLFRQTVLNVTNTYRGQHNATALAWNETLAEVAGEWSERCVFEHSGGPNGENLSSGYPNASASIIAWGHERVDYDFKKGEFSRETGHFTQLVWKATTTVGCARSQCNGKGGKEAPGWFVVCEYHPHGNVIGNFTSNVQAQLPPDEQPPPPTGTPNDPQGPSPPPQQEPGGRPCPQGGDCSAAVRRWGSTATLPWIAVGVWCLVGVL